MPPTSSSAASDQRSSRATARALGDVWDVTHATTMKSSAPLVYGTLVRSLRGPRRQARRGHTAGGAAGKECPHTPSIPASLARIRPRARDGREGLLGTPAADHALGRVGAGRWLLRDGATRRGARPSRMHQYRRCGCPMHSVMGALLLAPRRYWWFYLLAVLPAHLIAQLPLPDVTVAARH